MIYEKPEAFEIGSVENVVLGQIKRTGDNDGAQLPMFSDPQVVEIDE